MYATLKSIKLLVCITLLLSVMLFLVQSQ